MDRSPKKIKEEAIRDFKKYINLTQTIFLSTVGLDFIEGKRSGVMVTDIEEKDEYIDCFCSAGSFNVGRLNEEIVKALDEALDEYDAGNHVFASKMKAALAERLVEIAPAGLDHVFLCCGGGEANETAIKLARGTTGRPNVIAMVKAYHGHTGFSLSAIGKPVYRDPFEPLMPGFSHVPFNDLAAVEKAADDKTAAIILELVQGEGGIFAAKQEFVDGLRRLCDERGIMLIFDEVQTGFGRTGKMFACEHYGVTPDVMTVAKSLGGTIYPIAATLYGARAHEFIEKYPDSIVSTTGGSDLGCAVGLAVIEKLVRDDVPGNAARMGTGSARGSNNSRKNTKAS